MNKADLCWGVQRRGGWFVGRIDQGCGAFKYKVIEHHQGRGMDHEDWWCLETEPCVSRDLG